jgi:hypothetical protein
VRVPDDRKEIWNDPQRLEEWTNAALYAFGVHEDDLPLETLPQMPPAERRREALAIAIAAARRGNPEPLRRLFPALAEFIHSPPRRRGQRRPQTNVYERVPLENALDDVRDIRKIWQKHFGKSYAPRNGPSAISIAARRHGLSEDELVNFRKNRHRFRKNRQRKR